MYLSWYVWRACNWIWFNSLRDGETDKMGLVLCQWGSQQSVGEFKRVIWQQCGIIASEIKPTTVFPVMSTVGLSVLLLNLDSYTRKYLLTWWSWRTFSVYKHQYKALIFSHMYQPLGLNSKRCLCHVLRVWMRLYGCVFLCVHKSCNASSPAGAIPEHCSVLAYWVERWTLVPWHRPSAHTRILSSETLR